MHLPAHTWQALFEVDRHLFSTRIPQELQVPARFRMQSWLLVEHRLRQVEQCGLGRARARAAIRKAVLLPEYIGTGSSRQLSGSTDLTFALPGERAKLRSRAAA